MGRLPLLLLVFALAGCHHLGWNRAQAGLVSADDVDELLESAASDLRCASTRLETRPRTLLTRWVTGCGQERLYAYDPLEEEWVLLQRSEHADASEK